MRRARIQAKPNISKGGKQKTTVPIPVIKKDELPPALEDTPTSSSSSEPPVVVQNAEVAPTQTENLLDPPSESMRTLELDRQELYVDVKANNHHVHFTDDVIDNEQASLSQLQSPQFATPHPPSRLMTPRSRNVSMCEDELILQPKQRDKKRFSGKEELDTKTWKMSDLARWNPRNEHTSFKRERRSSTSSTIITKSEMGDVSMDVPRVNAPQVKIGADGRLVIDETSLVVQSAQINHESVWETVEEGRMGSKITSLSFRNRIFRKATLWSQKETDLFYEVLQCTGPDFGLMHHYLPQRSRPELKAKYNKEEKANWDRMLKVISHPVRLDGQLEERITKIMNEIEEEIQEKKARHDFEKAEEKRVRQELKIQKASEREEERLEKEKAQKLLRSARELERNARLAKKSEEKAEREVQRKERMNAKQMAQEARRIAIEAKTIIRTVRQQKAAKRNEERDKMMEQDSDFLEREAERIIRRLIQETRREERKNQKKEKKKKEEKKKDKVPDVPKSVDKTPEDEEAESSSDSSTSATSSDEEALQVKTAKREKDRMKAERRNLEPRKSVIGKKPVYVHASDAKYAHQPVQKAIEMAKLANGTMFNSADEDDDVVEFPENDKMDTSSPGPAPPPVAPEPSESAAPTVSTSSESTPSALESTNDVQTDEPIPKAVSDVVEEIARGRSKTPVENEKETKREEKRKREVEEKEEEEEGPTAKIARVEEAFEMDGMDIDVAETVDVETTFEESQESNEIVDVVTVTDDEDNVPCTSSAPSTSSAPPPSALAPKVPKPVRRSVKKPVTWRRKT